MKANYLVFPMATINITQSYTGTTSHKPHTTGTPSDYPIDCAGADTGRDYFICPCDEIRIERIYGVGAKGTNTVWLTSTSKVLFADGTEDYATFQVTHPNDDDLKKLSKGRKFKRGESIFREGSDGATANHLHISVGKGKIKGNGWEQNTKGKWVLTTTHGTIKPEAAFYRTTYQRVIKTQGLNFPVLEIHGSVTADVLNVRKGPGTDYEKVAKLTKGEKVKIYGFDNNFGKLAEGRWISLDYVKKVRK